MMFKAAGMARLFDSYGLRMISAQTRRVCREGKPASTFPDHALWLRMIFSENRRPLFRIMR
jgi:hypothetical protein